MPGDLHKLWRTRDPKGYHVEYGYSCMGYEIAGGLGVKLAAPDREVFVMVGDGSYLMMAQELVTAVAGGREADRRPRPEPRLRSRSARSRSRVGSQRFGTRYRYRDPQPARSTATSCRSTSPPTPPASAPRSLARDHDRRVRGRAARRRAPPSHTTVVHVETDPLVAAPSSEAWWDVPVAEVAELDVHARRARGLRAATSAPAEPT